MEKERTVVLMNHATYRIFLDIHDIQSQTQIHTKSGDNGTRRIVATLTENGRPFALTPGVFAVFSARKPDGKVLYNACTIEGNSIIYDLTEQTTAAAGRMPCEFKVYGADNALLTCPRFDIIVDKPIYHNAEVESTSEFSALTELVSKTAGLAEEVEQIGEEAEQVREEVDQISADAEELRKTVESIGGVAAGKAVLFSPQELTPAEQEQVKRNLGMEKTEFVYPAFTQGSIASTSGKETTSETRLRSGYINLTDVIQVVSSSSDYQLYGHYYDAQRSYVGNTGSWVKSITNFPSAYYLRLVARKTGDTEIVPSDVAGVFSVTYKKSEAVLCKPQFFTPEEQSQARANIGAVCDYYSTTREKLAVTLGKEDAVYADVTSKAVWGLYDALVAKYPDRIKKNTIKVEASYNKDGSLYHDAFENYEYVVSTGDYNEVIGAFNTKDNDIKKPKYLVSSGIHGWEKPSILSTYRLFRDIVTGHNIPARFAEGCVIHFLPIGNPWSLDHNKRDNEKGYNINRNFAWNWGVGVQEDKKDYIGTSANSEKETQAIANWLAANANANAKAQLFLDCHNISPGDNEIVTMVGLTHSEAYDKRKKIAMRGVDRVVPFWKDKIGYGDNTIFRNSASNNEGGIAFLYASEVLGIPSLGLELSARPTGQEASSQNAEPETIAVAAEVIGNVLIEFYEQYAMGEVVDMTETNEKIDALSTSIAGDMEQTHGKLDELSTSMTGNMATIHAKLDLLLGGTDEPTEPAEPTNGFRIERGVYTAETDASSPVTNLEIPCSPGAKIFTFVPDDTTRKKLEKMKAVPTFLSYIGQRVAKLPSHLGEHNYDPIYRGLNSFIQRKCTVEGCDNYDVLDVCNGFESTSDNTNGFKFGAIGLKAGTYNWAAYYWDEPEQG